MFSIRAQFKRTFLSPLNRALSPVTSNRGFRLCHMGARRLKQWLLSFPVIELARRTWRELGDDFAVDLAASISYYAILSLFPLAIGLVSLFSMVLEAEAVEREVFGFFRTYLPGSDGILTANVEAVGTYGDCWA